MYLLDDSMWVSQFLQVATHSRASFCHAMINDGKAFTELLVVKYLHMSKRVPDANSHSVEIFILKFIQINENS